MTTGKLPPVVCSLLLFLPLLWQAHGTSALDVPQSRPDTPPTCFIEQVTNTHPAEAADSSISSDGGRVVFLSGANITGQNPEGNKEIFLYEVETEIFTQVTDGGYHSSPSISPDGTTILFQSEADLAGKNTSQQFAIYLFDIETEAFSQIGSTQPVISAEPQFSADGSRVLFRTPSSPIEEERSSIDFNFFIFNIAEETLTRPFGKSSVDENMVSVLWLSADGRLMVLESNEDLTGENEDGYGRIFLYDFSIDSITQITQTRSVSSLSADGTRIIFSTFADPTGENADGNVEIFLLDLSTQTTTQITHTTDVHNTSARISPDGTLIAFESRADLTGQNPEGRIALFTFDTTTGSFTQIVNTGFAFSLSLSDNGTSLVFDSRSDPLGLNPDGNKEIFLYDATTQLLNQLTHTQDGVPSAPSIDAAGKHLAYEFGQEFSSENNIFSVDTVQRMPIPITNTSGHGGSAPRISLDGTKVAFESRANLTGDNPDENYEIFLYDADTETLSQITSSLERDPYDGFSDPSFSGDGNKLFFRFSRDWYEGQDGKDVFVVFDFATGSLTELFSTQGNYFFPLVSNMDGSILVFSVPANLTGQNPDENAELFLFDTSRDTLTQLTDTTETHISSPTMDMAATKVAFSSTGNFTGENADGNREIFLLDLTSMDFSQVTQTTEGYNRSPELSADGNRLVYSFRPPSKPQYGYRGLSEDTDIYLVDLPTGIVFDVSAKAPGGWNYSPTLNADGTRIAFQSASRITRFVHATLFLPVSESTTPDVPPAPAAAEPAAKLDAKNSNPDGWSEIFIATCVPRGEQTEAVEANFESPRPGPVSGISTIHGWAFVDQPDLQIDRVELFIDGHKFGDIPCCSEREDVQAAFPDSSSTRTLYSGWGMIFNWGTLSRGEHIIRVDIRDENGDLLFIQERVVTVIKPPGTEFIDQFDLSTATAIIEDKGLTVESVLVQDKATQERQTITASFQWFEDSQSFRMVSVSSRQNPSFSSPLAANLSPAQRPTHLNLISTIENPSPTLGREVSGVTVISGWVLAKETESNLLSIQLLIDGQVESLIPCCSQRKDVAAAFPDHPHALNSGWGTTFNYGVLNSGSHTVGIKVEDPTGSSPSANEKNIQITVVRPGDFEFLDQFDLTTASAWIEEDDIVLEDVRIRDKSSQQEKMINVRLRWRINSQSLGIIATDE